MNQYNKPPYKTKKNSNYNNLLSYTKWSKREEQRVLSLSPKKYQKLTYPQLFIAAEYYRFKMQDLIERANTLKTKKQINDHQYDFLMIWFDVYKE